jgi:hypothetical protein
LAAISSGVRGNDPAWVTRMWSVFRDMLDFLSIGPGSSTFAGRTYLQYVGCCGVIDPGLSAAPDGYSHLNALVRLGANPLSDCVGGNPGRCRRGCEGRGFQNVITDCRLLSRPLTGIVQVGWLLSQPAMGDMAGWPHLMHSKEVPHREKNPGNLQDSGSFRSPGTGSSSHAGTGDGGGRRPQL